MNTRRFSLFDLLGLCVCVLVVGSILLIGVRRQRTVARGETCENNLKQLGLAIHNYHSAYKQLPVACGGTTGSDEISQSNHSRLSVWVGLLPFAEQQKLWEKITHPVRSGDVTFPSMGPVPWYDPSEYQPWGMRPELLVCPSDKNAARLKTASSYLVCYGDAVDKVGAPYDIMDQQNVQAMRAASRGMFVAGWTMKFRDVLDGLANTLMFSEACIAKQPVAKGVADLALKPSLCIAASKDSGGKFWPAGREACWADGCLRSTGFQTILPPNSPSATLDTSDLEGVMSVSSHHPGGVHVAFADGGVRYILDSIDAASSDAPTIALPGKSKGYGLPGSASPYGLWGALGTRANKERIEEKSPAITNPPREYSEIEKKRLTSDKPLQVWTAANGTSTLKAHQIDLEREAMLVLLTEQGETRRVPLSKLRSEDAYRAVEQHLAAKIKAQAELKTQLQNGVQMLDNKEFEKFAVAFLPGADVDPSTLATMVEVERGLLIYQLESYVRAIESGAVRFTESTAGVITAEFGRPQRPAITHMRLNYEDGRWQFSIR